jgi:putative FmdB family regulatory protein
MPIFEYQCEQCEHTFEQLVRNNETVECPECQATTVTKLLSAAAAHVSDGNRMSSAPSCPYGGGTPPCQSGQCPGAG